MRRVLTFAAAAVAVLPLAACSSSGGTSGGAASSTAATPSANYLAALHQLHGAAVQGETFDELNAMSDTDLLQSGRTACAYLNHPTDHPYGPANDLVGKGYMSEAVTALAIAKAAKTYLCPTAPGSLTGE